MNALIFSLVVVLQLQGLADRKVYICNSPNAKKYHLKNDCKGLNRCTRQIIEINEEDAKKKSFELCKFENRK